MSLEAARLTGAAAQMGLELSPLHLRQIALFLDLLESWNRTYNLTSVRQRPDMLVQHIFDCLAIVQPLRQSDVLDSVASQRRCLDVGSGGGLPGVVIAMLFPEVAVVCVDAVGKKASFVRQVALETGLKNLTSVHARVEQLHCGQFDLVTSRAFASLNDFTSLTRSHLSTTGCWVAMKGVQPSSEISALPADINVFHVEQIAVPELEAARCLVWMKPAA